MSKILYFSHGDKGGVGKTLLARLVASYLVRERLPLVLVETDGGMRDFEHAFAAAGLPVELLPISGAGRADLRVATLFEGLAGMGDGVVVLNTPANTTDSIGHYYDLITQLMRQLRVRSIISYAVHPDRDPAAVLNPLLMRADRKVAVYNEHAGPAERTRFYRSAERARFLEEGGVEVTLPELMPLAASELERTPGPLWSVAGGTAGAMSLINRAFLTSWLAEAERVAEMVLGLDEPSAPMKTVAEAAPVEAAPKSKRVAP